MANSAHPCVPVRPSSVPPARSLVARRPQSGRLGQDLVDDWEHLVRVSSQTDLDGTLQAAGYRPYPGRSSVPTTGSAETTFAADSRLAELVREAATDPLAARVVLQRLLPGILSIARRRGRRNWVRTLRVYDDLLANAWLVIRCYPIERRPVRVAANLLRDVEYQTCTRPARLRRLPTDSWDWATWDEEDCPEALYAPPRASAFVEVVDLLRVAEQSGLDKEALALATALASGRSLEDLAAEHAVGVRALRYRRARLIAQLREVALDRSDEG